MYKLESMEATASRGTASPLAGLLRSRIERVLDSWEASGSLPGYGPGKAALRRFIAALDELVEAAEDLEGRGEALREPSAEDAPAAPCALLVTDDEKLSADLRRALDPAFRVDLAATAEEAATKATERSPDVLFAAGARAAEAVQRLRGLLPGLPAIVAAAERAIPGLLQQFRADPVVVVPDAIGAEGLALAVRALSRPEGGPASPPGDSPLGVDLPVEPRSYAHLTGLLPRALERTIEFDVGAAVIARPGSAPLVDVHATSDCSEATLELVRERALSLFSMVAGKAQGEEEEARLPLPAPFRSSIYVPLATEGRVVGLTYLASYRPDAFSGRDELMTELAAHASGAYRRLEAAVSRLRLTPRQSQVLSLIASGLSDKEVATRLGLAHRTVRTHIDRLLREHGLRSRTEAVAAWLRGQQG
jgi:DNA-binding CsgD family transcriptional regulator